MIHHLFMESVFGLLSSREMPRLSVVSGPLICRARNDVVRAFLNQTASEHLLFVDADMVFTPETLDVLVEADKPIVSALYHGVNADGTRFPVCHGIKDGRPFKMKPKGKGLTKVDGVGMGFCLIKRQVLEDVGNKYDAPYNWFQETVMDGVGVGEDLTFCVRAAALGHQSFIHMGTKVGHIKHGVL